MNKSLLEIDLERYISQINENALTKKMSFTSIKKFAKWFIENELKLIIREIGSLILILKKLVRYS